MKCRFREESFTRLGDAYRQLPQHPADPAREPPWLRRRRRLRVDSQAQRPSIAGCFRRLQDVIADVPRGVCRVRFPQGLPDAEPFCRRRSQRALCRYHQGSHVLRCAGFARAAAPRRRSCTRSSMRSPDCSRRSSPSLRMKRGNSPEEATQVHLRGVPRGRTRRCGMRRSKQQR